MIFMKFKIDTLTKHTIHGNNFKYTWNKDHPEFYEMKRMYDAAEHAQSLVIETILFKNAIKIDRTAKPKNMNALFRLNSHSKKNEIIDF